LAEFLVPLAIWLALAKKTLEYHAAFFTYSARLLNQIMPGRDPKKDKLQKDSDLIDMAELCRSTPLSSGYFYELIVRGALASRSIASGGLSDLSGLT